MGAAIAVVVKVGYALPGILPTSDLFMFIIESPLGRYALEKLGGEGGVLIAIALRPFGCSVVTGIIAGAVIKKFRFKRVFCYSALWVPLGNAFLGYLALSAASAGSQEQMIAMQKNFARLVWTDLWVYGWYFVALHISLIVTKRITRHSTGPAQRAAQAG